MRRVRRKPREPLFSFGLYRRRPRDTRPRTRRRDQNGGRQPRAQAAERRRQGERRRRGAKSRSREAEAAQSRTGSDDRRAAQPTARANGTQPKAEKGQRQDQAARHRAAGHREGQRTRRRHNRRRERHRPRRRARTKGTTADQAPRQSESRKQKATAENGTKTNKTEKPTRKTPPKKIKWLLNCAFFAAESRVRSTA